MSPRAQRTLYRLLALFLAAGAGDAIIQFITADSYDWRHLAGGLVVAAVMAGEKYLSEGNAEIAAPSVAGVNVALENQASSVAPPTIAVSRPTLVDKIPPGPDPNVPAPGI